MVEDSADEARQPDLEASANANGQARRHFLGGALAISSGTLLLSVGILDKVIRFFCRPKLTQADEGQILESHLERVQDTVAFQKLELERLQSNHVLIGPLDSLDRTTGKYFIDYQMRPALAFLGEDGLPILLSAKCTHLGCTVGNQVNEHNQVLCPCHISYFDIKTGQPNPGAPAKLPLDHIGWVLMDKEGKVIVSRTADGKTTGNLSDPAVQGSNVFIAKSAGAITS